MNINGDGAMGPRRLPSLLDAAAAAGSAILDPPARQRMVGFLDASRCAEGGYRGRLGSSMEREREEGSGPPMARRHACPSPARRSALPLPSPCPACAPADLYYTQFGLAAARALGLPNDPADTAYVAGFDDGKSLDFVHLTALLRCHDLLAGNVHSGKSLDSARSRLAGFRAADGGFSRTPHAAAGAPYDTFLAAMAGAEVVFDPAKFATVAVDLPTPVLAAALSLAAASGPVRETMVALLAGRRMPGGGFRAASGRPVPDLLSTAVALFALRLAGGADSSARTSHLAFVASLWNDDGGFSATVDDIASDCEYTFYALLAMGVLAS
jgi:hypothetical protein